MKYENEARQIRFGLEALGHKVGSGIAWFGFWIMVAVIIGVAVYTGQVTL